MIFRAVLALISIGLLACGSGAATSDGGVALGLPTF
jgi:hypothetical protein